MLWRLAIIIGACILGLPACIAADGITLFPAHVRLDGQFDRQQLLITVTAGGKAVDRTASATFQCDPPGFVEVTPEGIVTPLANGQASVVATLDGKQTRTMVSVAGMERHSAVTFERDVSPVLARAGCNSGPCHGKSRGQNGFQLSLLGFDPDFDFNALTQEGRGRRVFPAAPDSSLILLKGSGQVAHGGGRRLRTTDPNFEVVRRWIAAGTPRTPPETPVLARITVEPAERALLPKAEQQVVVTGHYTDGSSRDVTHLTMYQSNESVIAAVSAEGKIKAGPLPGEAAIMARFQEKFAVCTIVIPLPGSTPEALFARLPRQNFIDGLVWSKLQQLGITPSAASGDTTFLRRAYVDAIGRLPRPDEVKEFLADSSADKRARLVDRLLEQPEYADFWANKWADLLRPNPYRVGIKAVFNLDGWLRESFRENKPYDRFVRELLTAQGSTFRNGAAVVFRDRREPDEIATMASQLFLGVRLECAKCHHHPFEVWSQDDFYSFAAHFARIGRKGTGLSPPISGGEEVVFTAKTGSVKHPLTGKVLPPRPLFELSGSRERKRPEQERQRLENDDRDPRQSLADWIVSDDNPYFAKVAVNRLWTDLMGRGLVEPIDDLRATNPPSNGPLLDALADGFRKDGYDHKKLLRTIMTSYVYGLSSLPNERNVADLRNYSRHYRQALRGEVLLDAYSDITGSPETFAAAAPGTRAMELWTVRIPSVFLDSFHRPDPNQDPPCERTSETSVVQALHLMNAPKLHAKVTSDQGRAAQLAASKKTAREIVDELYLLIYSRYPGDQERNVALKVFERAAATRRQAVEDLMWAMLNTPEFLFKD